MQTDYHKEINELKLYRSSILKMPGFGWIV